MNGLFIILAATLALIVLMRPILWMIGLIVSRIFAVVARLRPRREGVLCPVCGYDIRATLHFCPECGTRLRWGMLP